MPVREILAVAWRALRANKVRAALTMFGVMTGSACIVLVVTIALSGNRYIVAQIEGVGSNLVYAGLVATGTSSPTTLGDEISLGDMQAVQTEVPEAKRVAGTRDVQMTMTVQGKEHTINVVGVTKSFQDVRNLLILRGRFFDAEDMDERAKVCLLTEQLSNLLFPNENPLGQEVHIGELTFTVVGVFRERIATFGQSEITSESVLVPLQIVQYLTGSSYIRTLYVQASRADEVPLVTQQVARILKSRHRVGPEYRVENLSSLLQTAHNISIALTLVLLAVAFIALGIGGVGIMNVMLITVTERTREIGIRMAVGARRREILYQFLLEALLLSGSGAVIGVLIAIAIRFAVRTALAFFDVSPFALPISWISVLVALVVCCGTGLFFGYLPASKAARLHPTEALHYE